MLALVVAFTALASCSTELIVTMFHPQRTRLALKCSRPPVTLTTRVSTLYVRLTNSLEYQDAILTLNPY